MWGSFGRVLLLLGLLLVAPATRAGGVHAGDVNDFFVVNERDGSFGGRLYAGEVSGAVDDGEILALDLSGGGRTLHYDADSDGDFEAFVHANADAIVAILFPSDLEGAVGVPGAAARALEAFDRLLDIGPAPPAGRPRVGSSGVEVALRNRSAALFEYERYRVDGLDGNGFSLMPGHDVRFENLEIGFSVPLRYSDLEDDIDTEAFTGGLDLHAKYHHYFFPEWRIVPLVGAGSVVFAMHSDNYPAAGYVRYGGYVGASTVYERPPFVVGAGVLYSVSAIEVPDGLVPRELDPLADALESRPADQQVTVGGKAAYVLPWRMLAAVGGRHLETVGGSSIEEGKQGLSQVSGSLMYFPTEFMGLEVGCKHLFGADDLRSTSAYLQGAFYF